MTLIGWLRKRPCHVISFILIFCVFNVLVNLQHGTDRKDDLFDKNILKTLSSKQWTALSHHGADVDCYHGYTGSNNTDEVMKDRSGHVTKTCAQMGFTGHRKFVDLYASSNILVNDDLKIIYCHIPHVASSTWMKTFVYAKGYPPRNYDLYKASYLAAFGFRKLGDYSTADVTIRLNTYFKFVFVRDPFERIVSAYKYLFNPKIKSETNHIYRKRLARQMSRQFRNISNHLDKTGQIDFKDYINFIAESIKKRVQLDSHVSRISQICLPCLVKYNAIGKLETFQNDATYILRKFYNNSCFETFRSHSRSHPLPTTTHREVDEHFKNVSQDTLKLLKKHYAFDRQLFKP